MISVLESTKFRKVYLILAFLCEVPTVPVLQKVLQHTNSVQTESGKGFQNGIVALWAFSVNFTNLLFLSTVCLSNWYCLLYSCCCVLNTNDFHPVSFHEMVPQRRSQDLQNSPWKKTGISPSSTITQKWVRRIIWGFVLKFKHSKYHSVSLLSCHWGHRTRWDQEDPGSGGGSSLGQYS